MGVATHPLGQALHLAPGTRVLDLASGSGEMLCTWARDHGVTGTGVDISTVFTEEARARVVDLTPFFCGERSCRPVVGGALVYKDEDHMTPVFAATLAPYLREALARAL